MILVLFLGFSFGFLSAIPVAGPVSAFIFSTTMRGRKIQARLTALGAGSIEAIYTYLAFLGVDKFLKNIPYVTQIASFVLALILGGLGVYFYRSKAMRSPTETKEESVMGKTKAFFMGAGMSAGNPSLIATWSASITALYSFKLFAFTKVNFILFSTAVGLGIIVWFFLLIHLLGKYRHHFEERVLDKILKTTGVILALFSLTMLSKLIF